MKRDRGTATFMINGHVLNGATPRLLLLLKVQLQVRLQDCCKSQDFDRSTPQWCGNWSTWPVYYQRCPPSKSTGGLSTSLLVSANEKPLPQANVKACITEEEKSLHRKRFHHQLLSCKENSTTNYNDMGIFTPLIVIWWNFFWKIKLKNAAWGRPQRRQQRKSSPSLVESITTACLCASSTLMASTFSSSSKQSSQKVRGSTFLGSLLQIGSFPSYLHKRIWSTLLAINYILSNPSKRNTRSYTLEVTFSPPDSFPGISSSFFFYRHCILAFHIIFCKQLGLVSAEHTLVYGCNVCQWGEKYLQQK